MPPINGYLLSAEQVRQLKRDSAKLSALRNGIPQNIGKTPGTRYFAKITGKYSGGLAPADVSYEAVRVIQDGATGGFITAPGGGEWGGGASDWPPLIDVHGVNYSQHGDPAAIEIVPDSVVEAFPFGNDDSTISWYCYGDDYIDDTYNSDSQTYYDSGHPETAFGDDGWDITDQVGTSGVVLTVQTGTVYNYLGDKVLYAFLRDLTFNAHGKLVAISVERRQTVDATDAC